MNIQLTSTKGCCQNVPGLLFEACLFSDYLYKHTEYAVTHNSYLIFVDGWMDGWMSGWMGK